MAQMNLDLSNVTTMSARVVVPTGNYSLEVANTEMIETKKKGWMLKVFFKVLAGEYAGSQLSETYNVVNTNEDAVRIGLSAIKTIMTVGGHSNPDMLGDSVELHGLKLNAYIEEEDHSFVGKDGDTVETTQNRFKGYYELNLEENTAPVPAKEEVKVATPPVSAPAPTPAPQPTAAPAQAAAAPAQAASPAPSAGGFPWDKK